ALAPGCPPAPYTTLFRSEQSLDAFARVIDRDQADAHPDPKAAVLPAQAQVVDRVEHGMGDALRLLDPAALHEDAEFVAAEAGERSEEHTSELQSRENLVC